jgi:hypothetical protein
VSARVTLLLTNSIDYVADVIVQRLGSDNIFRYNSDLWRDYKVRVTESSFELENPTGRKVREADVAKVYRRSTARASTLFPDRQITADERYAEEEVWSAWTDIVDMFWAQGKVVLVQPYAALRLGKLQQLREARKYFETTPYRFLIGAAEAFHAGHKSVVKSFSFKFEPGIGFYSQTVVETDLDPSYPWFLTDFVDADHDVTIAVVRDELFAFALDRSAFIASTIDWRLAPLEYAHKEWKQIDLPSALRGSIFKFMAECGAHYARLDFLRAGNRYVFLEANFTGEWAWLDPHGVNGLLPKILYEIDPRTPCVSVPRIRWSSS